MLCEYLQSGEGTAPPHLCLMIFQGGEFHGCKSPWPREQHPAWSPGAEAALFQCPFSPCFRALPACCQVGEKTPNASFPWPFISHLYVISHLSAKQEEEMPAMHPSSPCSCQLLAPCEHDVCALLLQPTAGCLP